MKNSLLSIFIFMACGCSNVTTQKAADSANSQLQTQEKPLADGVNPGSNLNEDLTTIPVASLNASSDVPTAGQEPPFPAGGFTESRFEESFASGQTKIVYDVRKYAEEEIRHGQYQEFYENGTLFSKGTYRNDRRHGTWEYFHPTGQPARFASYEYGIPSGEWKWFGENGEPFRIAYYQDGIKSGPQTTYWPDGSTIKLEEKFIEGKLNGVVTGFNESGLQVLELHFQDGKPHGKETRWLPTGSIAATGSYQDGRPHGLFTYYDEDGDKTSEVHWTNGRRTPGFKSSVQPKLPPQDPASTDQTK